MSCINCGITRQEIKALTETGKCVKLLANGCKYEGPYFYCKDAESRLTLEEATIKDSELTKAKIKDVCILVVTAEEIKGLINDNGVERKMTIEEKLDKKKFMGLASAVYILNSKSRTEWNPELSAIVPYGSTLRIIKFGDSPVFCKDRHFSGYTQSGALSAMITKIYKNCDLVICFGTAGGGGVDSSCATNDEAVNDIGNLNFSSGCVFIDRYRPASGAWKGGGCKYMSNIWGGKTIPSGNLRSTLELEILTDTTCHIPGSHKVTSNHNLPAGKTVNKVYLRPHGIDCAPLITSYLGGCQIGYKIYPIQNLLLNKLKDRKSVV